MAKQESLKEKTAQGIMWSGFSNIIQQVLGIVFGIILARKLSQADYGMVGLLYIFSAIAACMQEGGFIAALNRKKEVSQRDYNAVFWTSIFTSIGFYLLFFFAAPLIAWFYGVPELTALARYSFLSFLFVSFSIAPRAFIFRNMMVRESSIISIAAIFLSGVVGVVMAMNGYAYWGLATQNIVFTLTLSILNYYFSGWRPSFHIDFSPMKEILKFSSKLILSNIITAVNTNVFTVLLGKYYTPNEVGDFTQANKWNNMGHSLITNTLMSIAQPIIAKTEGDSQRQKQVFRKLLRFTAFICFPLMLGFSLVSEEFIVILITDKWISSAHILQWLCIAGAVTPLSFLFSNLLVTRGHSTTYMWCTFSFCLAQLTALWLFVPYGIMLMVKAYVLINILWLAVWFAFAHRKVHLSWLEALRDVTPYLALTIASIGVSYLILPPIQNLYLSILSKVAIVALSYCAMLWLLGSTIFKEVLLFITKKEIK